MASDSSNIALKVINNQMEVYNLPFGMHFGNKELEDGSCLYVYVHHFGRKMRPTYFEHL